MSPRVQLVIYPDGDRNFASHAAVSVTIDLPPAYSAMEVVTAVEEHLRHRYPLAAIAVEPAATSNFDARWHVYRDGLPAAAMDGE